MNDNIKKEITKVIIIGCGRMGASLALLLSSANKEVTIIDQNEASFRKLSKAYGGNTYIGDGLDVNQLISQDVRMCDLIICATNDDNTNIFIALLASRVFMIPHVYSRLYDNERSTILTASNVHVICPAELTVKAFNESFNALEVK